MSALDAAALLQVFASGAFVFLAARPGPTLRRLGYLLLGTALMLRSINIIVFFHFTEISWTWMVVSVSSLLLGGSLILVYENVRGQRRGAPRRKKN